MPEAMVPPMVVREYQGTRSESEFFEGGEADDFGGFFSGRRLRYRGRDDFVNGVV